MGFGNLFSTLNTSKSGLRVSQVQVDVTGKNVANANDEHYTRQRVASQALPKFFAKGRHIEGGNGVKSVDIQRVFNEFVYTDYRKALSSKEYSNYMAKTLKQVSDFFPELEGYGISNGVKNYFDSWSNLISNPNDPASKIALVKTASSLARSLSQARNNLTDTIYTLNKEIKSYVNEINTLASEIAAVNKEILVTTEMQKESDTVTVVNELKDRRDELELAIAKLVSIEVDRRETVSDNRNEDSTIEAGSHYVLNIGGFNIVDSTDSSPLITKSDAESDNLLDIKYLRQDEEEFNISSYIQDGKLGALLRLRGSTDSNGLSIVGHIQEYINKLDKFTQGLINSTNSIYAKTASNYFSTKITSSSMENVQEGSFFINMFDLNDNFVGQKEIFIDANTKIKDIVDQFNSNTDDNADGSASNDINDKFSAKYIDGVFVLGPLEDKGKYSISIDDRETNFAGALSLKKFFIGDNAYNIGVDLELLSKPEKIDAYVLTKEGKTLLGNSMVQLQNREINFYDKGVITDKLSLGDYFNSIMSSLSNDAKISIENNKTKETLFKSVQTEFDSIGRVSIDEELVNLMKFQAGYVSNAKVLTTVDEMINTLLGIKQ